MNGVFPKILEQHQIPMPLHGVNPRTIMGSAEWEQTKRAVYAKYAYCCAACGVQSRYAKFYKRLEAHENFNIDFKNKTLSLVGIEPLCHACHMFIHSGLLEVNVHIGRLKKESCVTILEHGISVLKLASGKCPPGADRLCAKFGVRQPLSRIPDPPKTTWSGWSLIWNGQSYPSLYKTETEWRTAMNKRN